MENSILHKQKYGCVRLRLGEVMDQRGIKRNQMAHLIDTRFEVVNKWYHGKVEKLDMDILARLCFALNCQVEDLLEYKNENPPES